MIIVSIDNPAGYLNLIIERVIVMLENKNNKAQEVKVDSCESKTELPKIAEVKVSKKDRLVFFGTCHCSNGGC